METYPAGQISDGREFVACLAVGNVVQLVRYWACTAFIGRWGCARRWNSRNGSQFISV